MMKKNRDFKYSGVEYDYHLGHRNGSSCDCGDDYCRCGTIEDAHVVSVDLNCLVHSIIQEDFKGSLNIIEEYCIDRLVRSFEMYDPSLWDVQVEGGYYGEEIGDVTFTKYSEVCDAIEEMLKLSVPNEQIEYVLIKEYGYLLDSLKGCTYAYGWIKKSEILFKPDYMEKVSLEEFYDDKHYKGIRAIVKQDSKMYRLIDGFHRVLSSKEQSIPVLIAMKE